MGGIPDVEKKIICVLIITYYEKILSEASPRQTSVICSENNGGHVTLI